MKDRGEEEEKQRRQRLGENAKGPGDDGEADQDRGLRQTPLRCRRERRDGDRKQRD
ncbi:MAG TPA: hypothetical protein VKB87_01945 [Myxococcaceae bacterium]|nr:hypothetical protein [Myxococcaceae bacterium]